MPKKKASVQLGLEKQLVSDPSLEDRPLFVNHFQVSHVGAEVYLDVGIVPLDDILSIKPEKQEQKVRFRVLQRLVVTPKGLQVLALPGF